MRFQKTQEAGLTIPSISERRMRTMGRKRRGRRKPPHVLFKEGLVPEGLETVRKDLMGRFAADGGIVDARGGESPFEEVHVEDLNAAEGVKAQHMDENLGIAVHKNVHPWRSRNDCRRSVLATPSITGTRFLRRIEASFKSRVAWTVVSRSSKSWTSMDVCCASV